MIFLYVFSMMLSLPNASLTESYRCITRQVKIIEEKKFPCVTYGVSTVDDEEIYFNYGGFNSVDDSSSGEVNKDSIFRICSQSKLITHARSSRKFFRRYYPSAFFCAVGCLTTYRKRETSSRFSCICLPPVYENPIILDDFSVENPSFKPATKVVRVEHLLNFSSGLFYDGIIVLPYSYTAKHDEEDPVGHFYNFIKVRRPSRCYKMSFVST